MADEQTSTAPVLIAYDGSEHARAAMTHACRLFPGRPVIVASAWRTVADVVSASLIAVPASVAYEASAKMDDAARTQAQEVAE